MKKILLILADLLYRKKCYFCRRSNENIKMCSKCFEQLEINASVPHRTISGINIYCAGFYSGNIIKLIRAIKYHGQKDLAYFLAKYMYNYFKTLELKESYLLIPVPLFKSREKKRKYNHMILVAEEFCKLTGYEINTDLISRVKDTKPQYKLNRMQRQKNLQDAFKINQNSLPKNTKLMLFDDICTTGTTFEYMIKELNKAGFHDIICFAASTPNINDEENN